MTNRILSLLTAAFFVTAIAFNLVQLKDQASPAPVMRRMPTVCPCGTRCTCSPFCNCEPARCPRCQPADPFEEVATAIQVGGPTSPDGKVEVTCDLPVELRTKNVGGRDGAGLCVFSSIGHAARWQNERRLIDFQSKMRQEPGGGYPGKVDRMIAKYAPGTPYVQHEQGDPTFLEVALAGGRMPSVTYNGRCPHYGANTRIAHMVNLVYLDQDRACVLDNNFVGSNDLVWLSRSDFLSRWNGNGKGWAVVLLAPPPPPVPHN